MMYAFLGMPEHVFSDCLALILFGVCGVLVIGFGTKGADWIWKYLDLEEQVQKGNIAAGIVMAAVVIGLCIYMGMIAKAIIGG